MTIAAMPGLWLVPVLPLAAFALLAVLGARLPRSATALLGAGATALAGVYAAYASAALLHGADATYIDSLGTWFSVAGFAPDFALRLDGLSLTMTWVVTGVGFLILIYATGFMEDREGYSRFFAYMNLFVFGMLVLVLANNLLLLYLGWEIVGLCSYLLIGFYYSDPANGYAARKAFVITRIGDAALAVALFMLFRTFGTLDIGAIVTGAQATWPNGSTACTLIAFLVLLGAVGKSAQLPLQTWLPDAMAGPVPVSALIHAATMVTAGVYLVARLHGLFQLAPSAQLAVTLAGITTLLLAAFAALTQRDIKRILAYSTMSQVGYMFLALGVGAWSGAIFHLMTHAFFKSLLFLGAGVVILALDHERDIYRMGGLRRQLPVAFWSMTIGAAALSALPPTAGYFSKDPILLASWHYQTGGHWLWALATFGALLTAMYSTRMIVIAFLGEPRSDVSDASDARMRLPLLLLSILAIAGGWLGAGPVTAALPSAAAGANPAVSWTSAVAPFAGVLIGWWAYRTRPDSDNALWRFWRAGWGFDAVYRTLIVRPFVLFARLGRSDVFDLPYTATAALARAGHRFSSATQSGRVRWYAAVMAAGLAALLVIALETTA